MPIQLREGCGTSDFHAWNLETNATRRLFEGEPISSLNSLYERIERARQMLTASGEDDLLDLPQGCTVKITHFETPAIPAQPGRVTGRGAARRRAPGVPTPKANCQPRARRAGPAAPYRCRYIGSCAEPLF